MAPRKSASDHLRAAIARAERRGITRYRIAKDAGITLRALSDIVNGASPRLDTAERIAEAIGYRVLIRRG